MVCPIVQTFRSLATTVDHTSPMNAATGPETTESRNSLVNRESLEKHETGIETLETLLAMPGSQEIIVSRTTIVETGETILIPNVE